MNSEILNSYTKSECLKRIKGAVSTATGCTEPVAIALCAAAAREAAPGVLAEISVRLDKGLYKNALGVVIPGINKRGIELCAALGVAGGKSSDKMNIFAHMTERDWEKAQALTAITRLSVAEQARSLYVEVIVRTNEAHVRAVINEAHDKIAFIESFPFTKDDFRLPEPDEFIRSISLNSIIAFAQSVETEKLSFLADTILINRKIMQKGLEMGYGSAAKWLNEQASASAEAQLAVGAASWARMAGVNLPVATATGSGNQGITLTLTIDAAARYYKTEHEKMLRALALGHLVNLLSKSYIGSLAPICSCGLASGAGAAAAVTWMLNGTCGEIFGSIKNMLGGIAGMLCDGAKEGCAHKAALSAYAAVNSARLSLSGCQVSAHDGICANDLHMLFKNIEGVIFDGMKTANDSILSIMTRPD